MTEAVDLPRLLAKLAFYSSSRIYSSYSSFLITLSASLDSVKWSGRFLGPPTRGWCHGDTCWTASCFRLGEAQTC